MDFSHEIHLFWKAIVSHDGAAAIVSSLGNLVPAERAGALAKYLGQDFTRKAIVVMGEPPKGYKDHGGNGAWGTVGVAVRC